MSDLQRNEMNDYQIHWGTCAMCRWSGSVPTHNFCVVVPILCHHSCLKVCAVCFPFKDITSLDREASKMDFSFSQDTSHPLTLSHC